jgi:hypothetical protein
MAMLLDLADKWGVACSLEGFGGLAAVQGQPLRAAKLLGAAEAKREDTGAPLPIFRQTAHERHVTAARTALGDEAFAVAWAEGRGLSSEQASAYALEAPQAQKTV